MADLLLLETGGSDNLLLETSGNLLLESSTTTTHEGASSLSIVLSTANQAHLTICGTVSTSLSFLFSPTGAVACGGVTAPTLSFGLVSDSNIVGNCQSQLAINHTTSPSGSVRLSGQIPGLPQDETLLDDLLAWWDFESDTLDSTANDNDLSVSGSDIYTDGLDGQAISGDDTFYCYKTGGVGTSEGWSVSGWIRPISPLGGSTWLSQIHDSGNVVEMGVSSVLFTATFGGGAAAFYGISGSTVGSWWHVVATNDGTTTKLYVNGQLRDSVSEIPNSNTVNAFQLLTDPSLNNTIADLDMVGVWNRELTEEEVNSLFNNGYGLSYPFVKDIAFAFQVDTSLRMAGQTSGSVVFSIGQDGSVVIAGNSAVSVQHDFMPDGSMMAAGSGDCTLSLVVTPAGSVSLGANQNTTLTISQEQIGNLRIGGSFTSSCLFILSIGASGSIIEFTCDMEISLVEQTSASVSLSGQQNLLFTVDISVASSLVGGCQTGISGVFSLAGSPSTVSGGTASVTVTFSAEPVASLIVEGNSTQTITFSAEPVASLIVEGNSTQTITLLFSSLGSLSVASQYASTIAVGCSVTSAGFMVPGYSTLDISLATSQTAIVTLGGQLSTSLTHTFSPSGSVEVSCSLDASFVFEVIAAGDLTNLQASVYVDVVRYVSIDWVTSLDVTLNVTIIRDISLNTETDRGVTINAITNRNVSIDTEEERTV